MFVCSDSYRLTTWLRDFNDDGDWNNAIDVAMGVEEMQCPDQLWEGLEENISSLNAVRQTLYNFIYREDELFVDLPSLLEVLCTLENVTPKVRESLHDLPLVTCNIIHIQCSKSHLLLLSTQLLVMNDSQ